MRKHWRVWLVLAKGSQVADAPNSPSGQTGCETHVRNIPDTSILWSAADESEDEMEHNTEQEDGAGEVGDLYGNDIYGDADGGSYGDGGDGADYADLGGGGNGDGEGIYGDAGGEYGYYEEDAVEPGTEEVDLFLSTNS